jgi:hypothetical protein
MKGFGLRVADKARFAMILGRAQVPGLREKPDVALVLSGIKSHWGNAAIGKQFP